MNDSPPRLQFTTEVVGDRCHLTLRGEFDVATCDRFSRLVSAAHAVGVRHFDIDVRRLSFAGACFANKLIELEHMLGTTVQVIDPSSTTCRVLEVAGLESRVVVTMPDTWGSPVQRPKDRVGAH